MSSVQVERLDKIIAQLQLLNSMLIGDISEDVSVKGRTRFKSFIISKASTIADSSSPKAANTAGVVNIQEANRFIITTDGNINNISYRVVFADGSISDEIELNQLNSLPGKFKQVQVNNDTAESGKNIWVRQFSLPPLLADNVEGALSSSVRILNSSGDLVDPKTDDPIATLGGLVNIGFTLAKKTTPIFKNLLSATSTENNYMTFEDPVGTDYSVPASKVFYGLGVRIVANLASKGASIGYADDGVADGVAAPTTPVYVIGNGTIGGFYAPAAYTNYPTTGDYFKTYFGVAAGKFPFMRGLNGAAYIVVNLFGVEVDV